MFILWKLFSNPELPLLDGPILLEELCKSDLVDYIHLFWDLRVSWSSLITFEEPSESFLTNILESMCPFSFTLARRT